MVAAQFALTPIVIWILFPHISDSIFLFSLFFAFEYFYFIHLTRVKWNYSHFILSSLVSKYDGHLKITFQFVFLPLKTLYVISCCNFKMHRSFFYYILFWVHCILKTSPSVPEKSFVKTKLFTFNILPLYSDDGVLCYEKQLQLHEVKIPISWS